MLPGAATLTRLTRGPHCRGRPLRGRQTTCRSGPAPPPQLGMARGLHFQKRIKAVGSPYRPPIFKGYYCRLGASTTKSPPSPSGHMATVGDHLLAPRGELLQMRCPPPPPPPGLASHAT
eukprot:365396-Chlamydomonas_euryale.AAC.14